MYFSILTSELSLWRNGLDIGLTIERSRVRSLVQAVDGDALLLGM